MTDSAFLKVDRANKHVEELNELFRKARPFVLVLETDTKTGKRSIFPKKHEAIINEAGLICGDAVHSLRSAVDHAYWEIISPHCTGNAELRRVQFPFAEKADRLDGEIHKDTPIVRGQVSIAPCANCDRTVKRAGMS